MTTPEAKPESREEQIGGRCKHFTGTVKLCCSVGVRYADVERRHSPIRYGGTDGATYSSTLSLPCIKRYNHAGAECEKIEFPTPEEVAAKIAGQDGAFRRMIAARSAIVEKLGPYKKRQSPNAAGTIPCPNCEGGTLHYSRAALNGHIHARCTTEGCAAWME